MSGLNLKSFEQLRCAFIAFPLGLHLSLPVKAEYRLACKSLVGLSFSKFIKHHVNPGMSGRRESLVGMSPRFVTAYRVYHADNMLESLGCLAVAQDCKADAGSLKWRTL